MDSWASFREAQVGRALFTVPGGILVINVQNPTAPYPQASSRCRVGPRASSWPTTTSSCRRAPTACTGFDIDSYRT